MTLLSTWDKIPREQLLAIFEKGNFAGVDEMRTNDYLLARVAPMGINDVAMACRYQYVPSPKLEIPITSFDGLADTTIDPGVNTELLCFPDCSHTNDSMNYNPCLCQIFITFYSTPPIWADIVYPSSGCVAMWGQYTTGVYRNVAIPDGSHYIVSSHYRQVISNPPLHLYRAMLIIIINFSQIRQCQKWGIISY